MTESEDGTVHNWQDEGGSAPM